MPEKKFHLKNPLAIYRHMVMIEDKDAQRLIIMLHQETELLFFTFKE